MGKRRRISVRSYIFISLLPAGKGRRRERDWRGRLGFACLGRWELWKWDGWRLKCAGGALGFNLRTCKIRRELSQHNGHLNIWAHVSACADHSLTSKYRFLCHQRCSERASSSIPSFHQGGSVPGLLHGLEVHLTLLHFEHIFIVNVKL